MGVIEIVLAAAVILLALASGYQARSLSRLAREIELHRRAVDELMQRQPSSWTMEALTDRIERERATGQGESPT